VTDGLNMQHSCTSRVSCPANEVVRISFVLDELCHDIMTKIKLLKSFQIQTLLKVQENAIRHSVEEKKGL